MNKCPFRLLNQAQWLEDPRPIAGERRRSPGSPVGAFRCARGPQLTGFSFQSVGLLLLAGYLHCLLLLFQRTCVNCCFWSRQASTFVLNNLSSDTSASAILVLIDWSFFFLKINIYTILCPQIFFWMELCWDILTMAANMFTR